MCGNCLVGLNYNESKCNMFKPQLSATDRSKAVLLLRFSVLHVMSVYIMVSSNMVY